MGIALKTEMDNRRIRSVLEETDFGSLGGEAYRLAERLYPICRSITGDGVRESLGILRESVPLEMHEVPTGTEVFDWTVPKEWNIRDAYVKNEAGERVIDFREHNLHVLNYSIPVRRKMSLEELRPHLHTLPDSPGEIPYRTSYFKEEWGFCMRQEDLDRWEEGTYEVGIDSSLEPGHLTYGELFLPGESEEEVLISTHCCHPSLCNDNLSGMTVSAALAGILGQSDLRYSYRFLWIPGTIGSITWLARNRENLGRIRHGLVLSCLGDDGPFTYKRSRRGDAEVDVAVREVLKTSGRDHEVLDFVPYGYDERQYCSPGINLPMGCLMRTPNGRYPEYHTSGDDLSLISGKSLGDSIRTVIEIFTVLEENGRFLNLNPECEPQLGRRGLYRAMGGVKDAAAREMAMLWVLNLSDGENDLLEIARRSGCDFGAVHAAAEMLRAADLLAEWDTGKES